jgi:probable phosphoglycerate mutase
MKRADTMRRNDSRRQLIFVRHGATQANLDGLRCGGDLDMPMTELGRRQIAGSAQQVREAGWPVDVIFASDLQRTKESAEIAGATLGRLPVRVMPSLRERRLGRWNLCPIEATEAALLAGQTPPGGESDAEFAHRIEGAITELLAEPWSMPLLVGSKGVARVLRQMLCLSRQAVGNGEVLVLDVSALAPVEGVAP